MKGRKEWVIYLRVKNISVSFVVVDVVLLLFLCLRTWESNEVEK